MTKVVMAAIRLAAALVILTVVVGYSDSAGAAALGSDAGGCYPSPGKICMTHKGPFLNEACGTPGECATCVPKPDHKCWHGDGPIKLNWYDEKGVVLE